MSMGDRKMILAIFISIENLFFCFFYTRLFVFCTVLVNPKEIFGDDDELNDPKGFLTFNKPLANTKSCFFM